MIRRSVELSAMPANASGPIRAYPKMDAQRTRRSWGSRKQLSRSGEVEAPCAAPLRCCSRVLDSVVNTI